jgi:RimJ/RimL family protein N-acetyltransferase
MKAMPRLIGRKVAVQPYVAADVTADHVCWLNDPEVVKYSNQRFRTHDLASCQAYFDSFAGSDNSFLSIRRLSDDKAVGTLTVYRNQNHGTADVGIMVGDPSAWGQGVGQDAWSLVINWLINDEKVRKVTAGTLSCNVGMLRLMQRSGMVEEAMRHEQELVEGLPQDIVYYARFGTR